MYLVRLTGKSDQIIHPKHLLPENPWFLAHLKKSDKVLDLGCGNGANSFKASQKVAQVIALDKKTSNFIKGNIQYIQGDLEKRLNFPDSCFDVVLCLDVLEHLHKRVQLMGEIKRVLVRNGKLYLSLPNKQTSWKKLQRNYGVNSLADADHKIEYTLCEIKRFCTAMGFKIVGLDIVTFDTPLAPIIDLVGGISSFSYRNLQAWKNNKVKSMPEETTGYTIICQK